MTHSDLVKVAERWLKNIGCGFVLTELIAYNDTGEIPDAIGFTSNESILVECKVSRSDFLADKKKHFRRDPRNGMGQLRYYLCPPDVIKPEDLPEKWGLLYVRGSRVECVVNKTKRGHYRREWHQEHNWQSERSLMYSALRRLEIRGHLPSIYDSPATELHGSTVNGTDAQSQTASEVLK